MTDTARSIIVELEHIRTIRRQSETVLLWCPHCAKNTDHLSFKSAVELFDIECDELLSFINSFACHRSQSDDDQLQLCLPSLVKNMRSRLGLSSIRLITK